MRSRIERLDSSSCFSSTLPPELMAEASRRLGWLGALYAGFGVLGHFGGRFLLADESVAATFRPQDLIFVATAIVGVALYVVSRRGLRSPSRLLDVGLVLFFSWLSKEPTQRPASALELATALATTVPPDDWTADKAHGWWQGRERSAPA